MCGIAGIVYRDPTRHVAPDLLARMCDSLTHRGPDEDGYLHRGHVGLAMRRLRIIDLAGGTQPIFNEDGSVGIVFNGEIYNYRELRRELEQKGHRFRTSSDTEVIVHLYEDLGSDCVRRLNGMFAFAIWDARRQLLLLARDQLGIKPLYYWHDGERLSFGSELKAILADPEFAGEIDLEAAWHYFSLFYIPAPFSIYRQVRKLEAGSVLEWHAGALATRRYWHLNAHPNHAWSEEECARALRAQLARAVERQLVSDVPLGAFLSGGLDSSTVVALMSELMDEPVKTFSIGFDEASHDEAPFARLVATAFGTDHHQLVVKPDAIELVDRLVGSFDEPFGDSSAIPTYLVSQMARQHVTVALSGDGGDECYGGYLRYLEARGHRRLLRWPRWLRASLSALGAALPARARGRGTLRSLGMPADRHYVEHFTGELKRRLFDPAVVARCGHTETWRALGAYLPDDPRVEPLMRYMYFDTMTYLPDDILVKVDRMSMAHSLEARVPLLDVEVVELAATIPDRYKVRGGRGKHILRRAMADVLPAAIMGRGKKGFGVPVERWFRHDLRALLHDTLRPESMAAAGFFDAAFVRQALGEHTAGVADWSELLWSLLMFELWYRAQRPAGASLPVAGVAALEVAREQ